MRKSAVVSLIVIVVLSLTAMLNAQSLAPSPTGSWTLTGVMSQARTGAAAAALSSGSVLVTGGADQNGVVSASVDLYGSSGTFTPVAPMINPRTGHTATWLPNASGSGGYVLVTGGTTTGGLILASAELYDTVQNTWTVLAAPMIDALTGEPATALIGSSAPNTSVLLSGGATSTGGTTTLTPDVELFNLANLSTQPFTFVGALPTARTNHVAAALQNGQVFIAGGTDASGNTLNTTAIYDPVAGTVTQGPNLNTPRANATATTLLDGTVLIAGGSYPEGAAANNNIAELNTAEIYNPTAGTITPASASLVQARAGQQAFLLPNNNNVLLVGGTYNGATLASSELYTPWLTQFAATGSMSVPRSSATGAALFPLADGQLLVSGGTNSQPSGQPGVNTVTVAGSAELYGFATVETDATDYSPGTPVVVTGTGWKPSENVSLTVNTTQTGADTPPVVITQATANGEIADSFWSPDTTDLGARFYLTATGVTSGLQAQNTFGDSQAITVAISPTGGGTVTDSALGISCPSACTHTPSGGTVVSLQATANSGYAFSSWSSTSSTYGCNGLSTNPCAWTTPSGSNPAITVTANFVVAPTKLAITTISPASPTAGSAFSVTVQSQNASGTATNVTQNTTITLSRDAGTGTLGGTLTGTITAGTSSVTITGVTYTKAESGVELTATASGGNSMTAATSSAFTVNPGALDHFQILASGGGAIGTQTAGTAFNIQITAQDVGNNTVTSFVSTASLTSSGTLTGSPVTTGTFTAGVLSSQSVTITSTGSVTLTATASSKTGTSAAFTVNPGALDHFKILASGGGAIGTQTAGTAFNIQITAQDINNNTVTSFVSTASLTSSGTLTGSPVTTGTFTAGVLSSQSVTITSTGSVTLTATASSKTGTSAAFTVNPGALDHFQILASGGGAIGTQAAGTAFNIQITAQDVGNNTVTSFVSTASLTSSGTLTGSPVTTGTFTAGVLSSQSVTITSTGSVTLTATASSKTGTSAAFTVNPGAATKLAITSTAVTTTAGVASTSITVQRQDAYGNPNTTDATRTVTLASSSTGTVTFNPASPLSISSGSSSATFTYTDTLAGTPTITAASTSPTTITSATQVETVKAAAASKLVFTNSPVTTTVGVASGTITVQRQDQYNNPNTTDATRTVTLSSNTTGTATFTPASPLSIASGSSSANFTYTDTKVGTPTITAASTSPTTITSATQQETVNPGALDHFQILASGGGAIGTQAAGTAFSIQITAQDVGNNTVTSFVSTASLTSSGTLTGSPVTTGTFTAGVLSSQSVTITSTGSVTLTATASSKTGTSAAFTVNPGVAAKLAFNVQPSATISGAAISPAVKVQVEDTYGNVVTSNSSNVTIAISAGGTLSSGSTLTVAASSGVATFSNLVPTTAATNFTLLATDGALTGATSNSFNVTEIPAGGTAGSGATSGSSTSTTLTWSQTVGSGSDQVLMVGVSFRTDSGSSSSPNYPATESAYVTGVTFGGQALTCVAAYNDNNTGSCGAAGTGSPVFLRSEVWYLKNPTVSTNTITVTTSFATVIAGGSNVYSGVNTVTSGGVSASNNGQTGSEPASLGPITTTEGDLVFDNLAIPRSVTSLASSTPPILTNASDASTVGNYGHIDGATSQSTAVNPTMSWTYSGTNPWANVAAILSPASFTSQSITVTTAPPASAAYNAQFTVAATASSGLTVAYTSSGSCTNSGATYTINSPTGTCSVIMNQAGNGTYAPAPTVTDTVTATQASQTITVTTAPPASAAYNAQFTVAATASSGLAVAYTSSGSCTNSGATYTINSPTGTCSVIMNQAGNADYSAAPTVTDTVTATQASQTISFTAPTSPVTYGVAPIGLSATGGGSGNAVTFTIDGTSTGAGSILGNMLTVTTAGTLVIDANQAGNANYQAAAQVQQSIVVNPASQLISFTAPTSPVTYGVAPIGLSATGGGSGNAVTFTIDGTSTGAGSILGNMLTVTTAGTLVIDANQAGNANYQAAAQVQQSIVVNPASQLISFTAPTSPVTYGVAPIGLSATATSALPVTFTIDATSTGTGSILGSTLTVTGAGTLVIDANQSGFPDYSAAAQAQQTIVVNPADYVVNVSTDDAGSATNCSPQTTPGVNTTDSSCSLRDALLAAAATGGGNISFDGTAFAAATTIPLTNGTLNIASATAIAGPTTGSGATLTNLVTVSGGGVSNQFSVFTVGSGVTGAAINNLIITNGYANGEGGGINNSGTLAVSNSTIYANSAPFSTGGGVQNDTGTLTVTGSTISGNSGSQGGGIFNNSGMLMVTGSTIYGNSAPNGGGGVFNNGGSGTLTVTGSTLSGNSSTYAGGGIYNQGSTLTLSNSIVAGNTAGTSNADIYGSYTDNGGNQADSSSATTSPIAINLAALGNYGGPTQTMPPLPASPAICGGLAANILSGVTTDQRGDPNTNTTYTGYSAGSPCVDSGAVQSNYSLSFTGEPSPISPATSIVPSTSFQAAVTLDESGTPFTGGSVSIPLTLTGTGMLSGGMASTDPGVASYSTLQASAVGTGDTLTANLTLTASGAPTAAAISATSSPFDITPAATTVAASSATATYSDSSQAVTLSATVSSTTTVNSGTVTFTVLQGGTTIGSPATSGTVTSGSASASYTLPASTPAATYTIQAVYNPGAGFAGNSDSSQTLIIGPASQTITVGTPAPSSAAYNGQFTVAATASSGLTVAYTSSGSCSNSGATYTMTSGTGTCSVIFDQAGNGNYSAAPQVTETVNATLATQATLTVTNMPTTAQAYGATFTVGSSGGSGTGTVTFAASGACSNSGGSASTNMTSGTGICSVTATSPANSNYSSLTSSPATVNATLASQAISVTTPAPSSAAYNGTFNVAATASSGLAVSIAGSGSCSGSGSSGSATITMTNSSGTCTVTFSQAGNSNYSAATNVVETPNATQATPTVTSWPTASSITNGLMLQSSTLSGGSASVAGSFAFTSPSTIPSVGTALQSVSFTPMDTTDYAKVAGTVSVTVKSVPSALTPVFSSGPGTYNTPQTVTLSSPSGAPIYYTTNGSTPTAATTPYSGGFTVSTTGTTIKAIAVGNGYGPSAVGGGTYTLVAAAPIFSSGGGTYSQPQSLTLSSPSGAPMYYTTNGSTPTAASTPYSGAITVSTTGTTIKAIAVGNGYVASTVASASYTLVASAPAFSSGGGTYSQPQSVTLSTISPGAPIYYTTNGSTPTAASTPYSGAITVSTTGTTIKAIAVGNGYGASMVTSATYTLVASAPAFSEGGGTYRGAQSVTLSTISPGAPIYYTTNGTTPTAASTPYSGAITVSTTGTTIKAIATGNGYGASAVASATYTIQ